MIIAIDETGSFGVDTENRSFFIAVHIRQRKTLYKDKQYKFLQWEKSIPSSLKNSKGEIKSFLLSDEQLTQFASNVVCDHYRIGITPYCIRPSLNPESIINKHRMANIIGIHGSAKEMRELGRPESFAATYDEFGNWLKKLSYVQYIKIRVLGDCISAALINTVGHSITGGYDNELTRIKFIIDRDFIKGHRQNIFWRELLRNQLYHHSKNSPLPILNEWRIKGHPFLDKYEKNGYMDFNELFWKNCSFLQSHEYYEIRVADAVNTILSRYYNKRQCIRAYSMIKTCFLRNGKITEIVLDGFNLDEYHYNPLDNPWRNLP